MIDPIGLDRLLPGWREEETPIVTPVTEDRFLWLSPAGAFRIPNFIMPPLMSNHGNFVASLGNVCRWLARKADALGVEIFPGFAAAELLFDESGAVIGVATGDMGIDREGNPKPSFTRGMELRGRYTLLAEGARGFLARQAIETYGLDSGRDPQKFGLGLKELWRVSPEKHRPGLVQHSFGWPLDNTTGGGSFLYHLEDNQVAVGFVVHLNYATRICRLSRSFSASRRIPQFGACSRAASGSHMARASSPKAAGSPCRGWCSPAARSSVARLAS